MNPLENSFQDIRGWCWWWYSRLGVESEGREKSHPMKKLVSEVRGYECSGWECFAPPYGPLNEQ